MAVDPLTTAASLISLAAYATRLVERHNAGEMTDDELVAAWAALQIRRDNTKQLWQDAKAAGGYT